MPVQIWVCVWVGGMYNDETEHGDKAAAVVVARAKQQGSRSSGQQWQAAV
jgi:hypothetical protein